MRLPVLSVQLAHAQLGIVPLVMRSSAAPLPVLGPGGPAVRVGLPPDDLG